MSGANWSYGLRTPRSARGSATSSARRSSNKKRPASRKKKSTDLAAMQSLVASLRSAPHGVLAPKSARSTRPRTRTPRQQTPRTRTPARTGGGGVLRRAAPAGELGLYADEHKMDEASFMGGVSAGAGAGADSASISTTDMAGDGEVHVLRQEIVRLQKQMTLQKQRASQAARDATMARRELDRLTSGLSSQSQRLQQTGEEAVHWKVKYQQHMASCREFEAMLREKDAQVASLTEKNSALTDTVNEQVSSLLSLRRDVETLSARLAAWSQWSASAEDGRQSALLNGAQQLRSLVQLNDRFRTELCDASEEMSELMAQAGWEQATGRLQSLDTILGSQGNRTSSPGDSSWQLEISVQCRNLVVFRALRCSGYVVRASIQHGARGDAREVGHAFWAFPSEDVSVPRSNRSGLEVLDGCELLLRVPAPMSVLRLVTESLEDKRLGLGKETSSTQQEAGALMLKICVYANPSDSSVTVSQPGPSATLQADHLLCESPLISVTDLLAVNRRNGEGNSGSTLRYYAYPLVGPTAGGIRGAAPSLAQAESSVRVGGTVQQVTTGSQSTETKTTLQSSGATIPEVPPAEGGAVQWDLLCERWQFEMYMYSQLLRWLHTAVQNPVRDEFMRENKRLTAHVARVEARWEQSQRHVRSDEEARQKWQLAMQSQSEQISLLQRRLKDMQVDVESKDARLLMLTQDVTALRRQNARQSQLIEDLSGGTDGTDGTDLRERVEALHLQKQALEAVVDSQDNQLRTLRHASVLSSAAIDESTDHRRLLSGTPGVLTGEWATSGAYSSEGAAGRVSAPLPAQSTAALTHSQTTPATTTSTTTSAQSREERERQALLARPLRGFMVSPLSNSLLPSFRPPSPPGDDERTPLVGLPVSLSRVSESQAQQSSQHASGSEAAQTSNQQSSSTVGRVETENVDGSSPIGGLGAEVSAEKLNVQVTERAPASQTHTQTQAQTHTQAQAPTHTQTQTQPAASESPVATLPTTTTPAVSTAPAVTTATAPAVTTTATATTTAATQQPDSPDFSETLELPDLGLDLGSGLLDSDPLAALGLDRPDGPQNVERAAKTSTNNDEDSYSDALDLGLTPEQSQTDRLLESAKDSEKSGKRDNDVLDDILDLGFDDDDLELDLDDDAIEDMLFG